MPRVLCGERRKFWAILFPRWRKASMEQTSATLPSMLLDTHAWLWLEIGEPRLLQSAAMAALEQSRKQGGLLVSVISVWELAMLEAAGKIRLQQDCRLWSERALSAPGIFLQDL